MTKQLELHFTPGGWEDYQWWVANDRRTLKKLNRLITDTLRTPYSGIGKPEQLKHSLAGAWSRHITGEHRFVYLPLDTKLSVLQAKYHY
jgi:toxin YoeB